MSNQRWTHITNEPGIPRIAAITTTCLTKTFMDALAEIKEKHGTVLDFHLYYAHQIDEELVDEELLRRDLQRSDIVLVDIRGQGKASRIVMEVLPNTRNTVMTLVGGSSDIIGLTRIGSFSMSRFLKKGETEVEADFSRYLMSAISYDKIERITSIIEKVGRFFPVGILKHARNWVHATKYWSYAGKENIKNLLLMVAREYGEQRHLPKPKKPIIFPDAGIYHPKMEKTFEDLQSYLAEYGYDEGKQTVGILFYGGMHRESSLMGATALIERLEPRVNVIPVFSNGIKNLESVRRFFFKNGNPLVDAVVSFMWFVLNGGPFGGDPKPTLELLQELNAPLFDACPMYMREVQKWRESEMGLSPIEVICAVTLPELDGCIEPIPSVGLGDLDYTGMGYDVKTVTPIDDRIERIADRVLNWVELRRKPNSEKKIALILYNYPPGEDNIGNAAYLDVFESVERILERLKQEGYSVKNLPEGKLHHLFLDHGIANSSKWLPRSQTFENAFTLDKETYLEWFSGLPEKEAVIGDWGKPPGSVMSYHDRFIIPGIELGNIFVGLQPSRGLHEEPEKAYHDKTLTPHHQYIAFYMWLERIWKADLCVHVGTHGTVEFTKGKEIGMSNRCFPEILIGNLPHLYIYHVTNPSEAMIAKRRSLATIINHNSPAFTTSDVYEEMAGIEDLIHEYNEAMVQHPVRAKKLKEEILERAKEAHFESGDIDEIHHRLFEIKRSIIPKGLHVLGEKYDEDELVDFLTFILRYDRGAVKSLNRILAESEGIDYEYAIHHPDERMKGKSYAQVLEEIESESREIVEKSSISIDEAIKASKVSESMIPEIRKTLEFGHEVSDNLVGSKEVENLVRGMNGEYIKPNIGGDPVRTPEVLPTGCNTYQFDPRLVPSQTACVRGAEIAENTLRTYFEKHGRYPRSVGVVLWGFETAKTRGESVGQILRYIGVEVAKEKGAWFPELKVVPIEELKRPRIDVVVNICGFLRDLFPNVMRLLGDAFDVVASLDEPCAQNFVKEHSEAVYDQIKGELEDGKLAHRLANARIFGPRAGEYGTRVPSLIETSNWGDESQLAEAYIQSMNHAYAENVHSDRVEGIYRSMLSNVEVVSQVRDTHEYEITDLDHYYEFLGGLSKSVETVSGKKPEMLITDTTKEAIKTESIEHAIRRGVRTRLLNPRWINAMLEHDYHGAQKIRDRVEYELGLAATTGAVDNWIWSETADRYVFDEEMRRRLAENNPWATAEIIKRLFEANKRGYWEATEEELEKLKQAYLEAEGWIEETI